MIYPSMRGKQSARISIPLLSGGLNVSRQATEIFDNQLTECTNMWFNDGVLKTRPGVECNSYYANDKMLNTGIKISYNGKRLRVYRIIKEKEIGILFYDDNGTATNGTGFSVDGTVKSAVFAGHLSASKQYIYCYYSYLKDEELLCGVQRFKIDEGKYGTEIEIEDLTDIETYGGEYYEPTVIVNNDFTNDGSVTGTTFEGYNLLNGKHKILCTSKDDEEDSNYLHAYIPSEQKEGASITVEFYTKKWGYQKFVVDGQSGVWDADFGKDDIIGELDEKYKSLNVRFENKSHYDAQYSQLTIAARFTEGNGEGIGAGSGSSNVILHLERDVDTADKVCCNTQAVWYGGSTGGISGGSFLFMAGAEPNKLIWSDVDNPLYFPENNYLRVGSDSEKITKLAKMGNNLVIFKEHSVYIATCVEGEGVTVEQLSSGAVTDVTSYAATFPTANINDDIGCDLPETVQLCRNRLVWANSTGKVYQIVTHSMTSERNIYAISGNIEKLIKQELKKIDNPKLTASATSWQGYYLLSLGNKTVFVMNYDNYGFTNIYSYSKTDDAESRIEWYKWEFVYDVVNVANVNENVLITVRGERLYEDDTEPNTYNWVCRLNELSAYDNYLVGSSSLEKIDMLDIPCSFATKWFDFGMMDYYKSIEQVYLTAGSEKGGDITLSYITQRGTVGERIIGLEAETPDNENFIKTYRQLPMQKRLRHFGLKISSPGQFVFGGFVIKFKVMGGIK
ncbi:MAG: hypothetical protein IIW79_02705 [Clostridia bacterium]|nr:hypothetical protein [Clostridia bacterium]